MNEKKDPKKETLTLESLLEKIEILEKEVILLKETNKKGIESKDTTEVINAGDIYKKRIKPKGNSNTGELLNGK